MRMLMANKEAHASQIFDAIPSVDDSRVYGRRVALELMQARIDCLKSVTEPVTNPDDPRSEIFPEDFHFG